MDIFTIFLIFLFCIILTVGTFSCIILIYMIYDKYCNKQDYAAKAIEDLAKFKKQSNEDLDKLK